MSNPCPENTEWFIGELEFQAACQTENLVHIVTVIPEL
jgi:hypothetical protein